MMKNDYQKEVSRFFVISLVIFFLIAFRVWHISVIQRETRLCEARKPQRKTIVQKANRGLILDRYGEILATNCMRYDATIYFAQVRQIPQVSWKKNEKGEKIKIFPRKEYITALSRFLAKELDLEAEKIEDGIYAKAAFFPHTPYVLKQNISEKTYYRLRMLERDWAGLHAEIQPERFYPRGFQAANLLGYIGAISSNQYLKIADELHRLEDFLKNEKLGEHPEFPEPFKSKEEILNRYQKLKRQAYGIHDFVGKTGLEAYFEETLRGFHGKKTYTVDIKGNFLQLIDDILPEDGQTLKTSISIELQDFAEKLLAQDEKLRDGKSRVWDQKKQEFTLLKQPLMKGGAIVAMDPKNGEILALASYPTFDPNDFVMPSVKKNEVNRWLENEQHIRDLWEGRENLKRKIFSFEKNQWSDESFKLTWENYLDSLFPKNFSCQMAIKHIDTIKNAIELQEAVSDLLYYTDLKQADLLMDWIFPKHENHQVIHVGLSKKAFENIEKKTALVDVDVREKRKIIKNYLGNILSNEDKLFVVDLSRLIAPSCFFTDELIHAIGSLSLSEYFELTRAALDVEEILLSLTENFYEKKIFSLWRKQNEKEFLKRKRLKEAEKKVFSRPYTDYLYQKQKKEFAKFWQTYRLSFLAYAVNRSQDLIKDFSFIEKSELDGMLLSLKQKNSMVVLGGKLSAFSSEILKSFFHTVRPFHSLDEPLLYSYRCLKTSHRMKDLASAFYPTYGFGHGFSYAYQQGTSLGSIFKVVTSYAALQQKVHFLNGFSSFSDLNPLNMIDCISEEPSLKTASKTVVGYTLGHKPYPRMYKGGRLPKSSHPNVGQIDLLSALERSSNPYFAILAKDVIESPKDLLMASQNLSFGNKTNISLPMEFRGKLPDDLLENPTGLYSFAIGQHSFLATPLQTAVMLSAFANGGKIFEPKVLVQESKHEKKIEMNSLVRSMVLTGMKRVLNGESGSARPSVIQKLKNDIELRQLYDSLSKKVVGKTSTVEIMDNPYRYPSRKPQKVKHIWFGSIGFESESNDFKKPEIVVVVFLRYGDAGREAAPLALQMIQKYREIKKLKEPKKTL